MSAPPDTTSSRVLWLTGLGHGFTHSWELIFPAVSLPMAAALNLSLGETVLLSQASYLLFGLGSIPAGWATDRYGSRPVLLICLLLGSLSALGVAAAQGPGGVALALAGLGLAGSLYHPAGLALLARQFPDRSGRAFALNGIAGNVGLAATPFVAGLLASVWGWRIAFASFAVPGLAAGIALLFLPFEARAVPPRPLGVRTKIDWRPLVWLALAMTCGGLVYRFQSLLLPPLLSSRGPHFLEGVTVSWLSQVDNLEATAFISLAYALGLIGQLWGGKVADRGQLERGYFVFHALAAAGLSAVLVARGLPLTLALIGYVLFAQGMQPIENSLVARAVPAQLRGRAYATKFLLTFGVGSSAVAMVAALLPTAGLTGALGTAFSIQLALVALAAWMWRRAGRVMSPGHD